MKINVEDSKLYGRLKYARHGVFILVGTGQHGKTVTMHALLNSPLMENRNVALLNYPPQFVKAYLPERYRAIKWPEDIYDVPKIVHAGKDVLAIDDAVFFAGARSHATRMNKDIQQFLTISSHHELFIIICIQNLSLLDFSLVQSQDVFLIHKQMDITSLAFERPEMKRKQVIANAQIRNAIKSYPELHPKGWSYCSTTWELLFNGLPDYWVPQLSKPFFGVIP